MGVAGSNTFDSTFGDGLSDISANSGRLSIREARVCWQMVGSIRPGLDVLASILWSLARALSPRREKGLGTEK